MYHRPKARKDLRFHQLYSGPVIDQLHAWLTAQFTEKKVEPNSGLGMAMQYLLKHWIRLTLFLREARGCRSIIMFAKEH